MSLVVTPVRSLPHAGWRPFRARRHMRGRLCRQLDTLSSKYIVDWCVFDSQRWPCVSFKDCSFEVDKKKENTGRAAVARECALIHSYTLEASFCGSNLHQDDSEDATLVSHCTVAASFTYANQVTRPGQACWMRFCAPHRWQIFLCAYLYMYLQRGVHMNVHMDVHIDVRIDIGM